MRLWKAECSETFKLRFVFLSEVTFLLWHKQRCTSVLNGEVMEATTEVSKASEWIWLKWKMLPQIFYIVKSKIKCIRCLMQKAGIPPTAEWARSYRCLSSCSLCLWQATRSKQCCSTRHDSGILMFSSLSCSETGHSFHSLAHPCTTPGDTVTTRGLKELYRDRKIPVT